MILGMSNVSHVLLCVAADIDLGACQRRVGGRVFAKSWLDLIIPVHIACMPGE